MGLGGRAYDFYRKAIDRYGLHALDIIVMEIEMDFSDDFINTGSGACDALTCTCPAHSSGESRA